MYIVQCALTLFVVREAVTYVMQNITTNASTDTHATNTNTNAENTNSNRNEKKYKYKFK